MSSARRSEHIKSIERRYRDQVSELADFGDSATRSLVEAFSNVVADLIKIEDDGWLPISQAMAADSAKGMSLEDAKKVTKYLEKQTKVMGGLLGRGLRLKNNHAFGRGYDIRSIDEDEKDGKPKTWVTNIIEDEDNWATIFSPTALKELNRILFTSGNLFVSYDSKTKLFERLAIDVNIENALTYPENRGRLKYILRSYTTQDDISGEHTVVREWIPTFAYRNRLRARGEQLPLVLPGRPGDSVATVPVHQTAVVIEKRINKDNGDTWGVPDAFGAAPWAVLYSTYLKDGAKLQNALSAISFLIKAKTEEAAKRAGAKLSSGRVGSAAIGGPETEVSQVPRAGAVNLYEGRPIQAQVAANLDVSATGIASDPGPGGSYASENALSQPEQLAALSRQEDFAEFFRQVFAAMGARTMVLDFRRLDVDPIHRSMQSLTMAREQGGINQQEYRNRSIELLDIEPTSGSLPEPDDWTGTKATPIPGDEDGQVTPGQGKSGSVGSLDDNGNSARNDDKASGTA